VDEFLAVQAGKKRPGVAGWWEQVIPALTDKQADDLVEAARNPAIAHRTISIVLGQWGHAVTDAQVGHWRRNHVR
jgi:hypothetical protein